MADKRWFWLIADTKPNMPGFPVILRWRRQQLLQWVSSTTWRWTPRHFQSMLWHGLVHVHPVYHFEYFEQCLSRPADWLAYTYTGMSARNLVNEMFKFALKAGPCGLQDSLLMQKLNLPGEQLFCPKALRHGACTCGVQSAGSVQMETSFQAGNTCKGQEHRPNAFAESCTPPTKSAKSKCSVSALSQTSGTVCLKTDPFWFSVFLSTYLISYTVFIISSFHIMRPVSSWDSFKSSQVNSMKKCPPDWCLFFAACWIDESKKWAHLSIHTRLCVCMCQCRYWRTHGDAVHT